MKISNQTLLAQSASPGYVLLEPSIVPGEEAGQAMNLEGYLQGAYVTLFVLIIASAVLSLVYYGFTYMTSDIPKNKASARERLDGIVLGLVIALSTVLILNEINPELLKFNLSDLLS